MVSREEKRHRLGWAVLAFGIGCIVLGICRNEVAIIYVKAIRICLECIGLG